MPRPLEGVRILAIEQFGAGPFGSLHLADLGAEVIKIEDPNTGGDVSRTVPPYVVDGDSLYFESFNRNKKSIALDLAVPAGRAVFEDLVVGADAIYSNLRGDVPAALDLRYADVAHLNPAIVCCSLSGFGMSGPRMREPGYDYIVQGMAGWMDVTGEPDGPPTKSGLSLVDFSTGYVAALALTSGLLAARRDGVGMDCDVSLFDTAISMLSYLGVWHLNEGYQPQRISRSAHPSLVPFGTFETADGWLVIACPKDKFWHRLAGALGRPELAADERFRTFADRHRNANELSTIIDSILRTRQRADWLTLLRDAGVPVGEVNSVEQALADPQTVARGMIVETDHPTFGTMSTIASPVRVGSTPPDVRRAPFLGEHTEALLTELLHYDRNRIDEAARAGAFGAASTD